MEVPKAKNEVPHFLPGKNPFIKDFANKFGIPFELTVVSAHRTPLRMVKYATTALERGLKVIIAGAGGAAHFLDVRQ